MQFEHLKRRVVEPEELYSGFKEVIDRTRNLNLLLKVLLDSVEEYWGHREIELAAETLLNYVIEDDALNDVYSIEIKHSIRLEILFFDVVNTLLLLDYLGSTRHTWQSLEVVFYQRK